MSDLSFLDRLASTLEAALALVAKQGIEVIAAQSVLAYLLADQARAAPGSPNDALELSLARLEPVVVHERGGEDDPNRATQREFMEKLRHLAEVALAFRPPPEAL